MERPADLFDREQEWADLNTFGTSTAGGLRLGVVWGRRRQGKSFLLRRLSRAAGGLYHQALQVERAQALERFSGVVGERLGLPPGAVQFPDWAVAFRTALGLTGGGAPPGPGSSGPARLLVLDELPYLLDHSPEIPSVLQEMWDESQDRPGPPAAVIVCGSALSVMADLLSGTRALRGRVTLNLLVRPFDFRLARSYWGIDDPQTAFLVDALVGGTPGYRALLEEPAPEHRDHVPRWLSRTLLNPAHALFDETGYLLREDPRVQDKALYNTILNVIATGRHSPREIGRALGRPSSALTYALQVLTSAGFVRREEDVLLQRRPTYFIADPIVRLGQLVIEPYRELLEERQSEHVWAAAQASVSAQILGPHFERLAQTWTQHFAGDRWPEPVGPVGPTVLNDRAGKAQHQIDVVALPRGTRRQGAAPRVVVLGEAKAANTPRTPRDLERLDLLRTSLMARGVDAGGAHLALFGRNGFDRALHDAVRGRSDVHLIDLEELYR